MSDKKPDTEFMAKWWTLAMQSVFTMLSGVIVGLLIDRYLRTTPVFILIMTWVGMGFAGWRLWRAGTKRTL